MIAVIHISQKVFAVHVLTALKYSLEQRWKHILRLLRQYGDQAKEDFKVLNISFANIFVKINNCDHYNDLDTKPIKYSLKACCQTCACNPYDLHGD